MKRRVLLAVLGGAAVAAPLVARAQQPAKIARIGMLLPRRDAGDAEVAAGIQRLRELGWTDGQNLRIDYRWVPGTDIDVLRFNAAELVKLAPDVIWVLSNPAVAALQRATRTIPIVFVQVADPVGSGFVESLAAARRGSRTSKRPWAESGVVSGGLLSYASDATDLWRRSAAYVDRILRGANAGDLPVQAPTKFELVINLKAAKAAGFGIPPKLLARADSVVE